MLISCFKEIKTETFYPYNLKFYPRDPKFYVSRRKILPQEPKILGW